MLFLLLGSGFFSGSETALFSLSRSQLLRVGRRGKSGRMVTSLLAQPRKLLNTLLFGNMLINVCYMALSAIVILDFSDQTDASPLVSGLLGLFAVLLLILLGEVTPKTVAYSIAERWALTISLPVALISRMLSPVLWILDFLLVSPLTRILAPHRGSGGRINTTEFRAMLNLSARRGVISRKIGSLLHEIVGLADLRINDIMVPRVDVVSYNIDKPAEGGSFSQKEVVSIAKRLGLECRCSSEASPYVGKFGIEVKTEDSEKIAQLCHAVGL